GFLPYFATYMSSNFLYSAGLHLKHCDCARLWMAHQSLLSLNFFLALAADMQMLHISSGTPCSSHHQPACVVSTVSVSFGALAFPWEVSWLQPIPPKASTAASKSELLAQ